MSNRIDQILQVLKIVHDSYEPGHKKIDVSRLRHRADEIVAGRYNVGYRAVQDTYRRQLEPFTSGTSSFDQLVHGWLAFGSPKLHDILLQRSVDKEDKQNIQVFFEHKFLPTSMLPPIAGDNNQVEETFLEGEKRAATTIARNPQLRIAAKKKWGLSCYCCGFNFEEFYGDRAKDFAIVHHLEPFAELNGEQRESTVEDVRVVCANCHYVLHFEIPPLNVDALKKHISQSWSRWSDSGVKQNDENG